MDTLLELRRGDGGFCLRQSSSAHAAGNARVPDGNPLAPNPNTRLPDPNAGPTARAPPGYACLYPRCSATIPPVRFRQATFDQPLSCIRAASAGWSGQTRMDSAR